MECSFLRLKHVKKHKKVFDMKSGYGVLSFSIFHEKG